MPIAKLITTFPNGTEEFLVFVRNVKTSMTDNPNFRPPWVGCSLEELIDCLERLQKASDEAKHHGTLKILLRDQIRAETTAVLRNIIKYVELVARGNIQILKSSGFELQKERRVAPAGQLPQPEVFLKHGERRRSIVVKAKALPGAGSYEVQITDKDPNIEANWGGSGVHLKCGGIVLDNLNSGTNYWVRMRGIGTNGPGEWSTPATIMSL